MEREEFIRKISDKSYSVRTRLLTEYDFYSKFNGTDEEYIKMRLAPIRSHSRAFNRIYDINAMFRVFEKDVACKISQIGWGVSLNRFYCTEKYLRTVDMNNPIDRFMLLFFFYGYITSNDFSLCNLKYSDINIKTKEIIIDGKKHTLSDYDISLIKEIKNTTIYKTSKGEYKLCDASPYFVQKVRLINSTTPCSYSTIKTRLEKVNEELGTRFSRYSLKISGIASRLYAQNSEKYYWNLQNIEVWRRDVYRSTFCVADVYLVLCELYYNPSPGE